MTTSRLKEKLSILVANQLPEHIRTDYTTFVAFLEAYYEYLEQDQQSQELLQNALQYSDIDDTIDSFIQYFLKEYCYNLPLDATTNKRFLIKQINQLYNTKGSEKSYELLFQLIFGKKPDFIYPSTQVLRASDGKWVQPVSIFVKTIQGDPNSIVNKFGTVISSNNQSILYIKNKRDVVAIDPESGSINLVIRSDVFEFVIDNSKNVPIEIGDVIDFGEYRGIVQAVPVRASIVSSGIGFTVGQIFNIVSGQGRNARVKITKVSSTGVILSLAIIAFNINYNQSFYAYISSAAEAVEIPSFDFGAGNIDLGDRYNGLVDYGYINKFDYSVDAFDGTYAGTVVAEFYNDSRITTGDVSPTGQDAVILITVGGKARYPGYYKNNDGFISDEIYLEDRDYFTPFSYVIKIDEQLKSYKKAVLDILHPAGTKLFGNYLLTNTYQFLTEITSALRFSTNSVVDLIVLEDEMDISFSKAVDDTAPVIDFPALTYLKNTSDNNISLSDITDVNITKNVIDLVNLTLDIVFSSNIAYVDQVSVADSTNIETTINISDSSNITDSGGIYTLDYTSEEYFVPIYVGTLVQSI